MKYVMMLLLLIMLFGCDIKQEPKDPVTEIFQCEWFYAVNMDTYGYVAFSITDNCQIIIPEIGQLVKCFKISDITIELIDDKFSKVTYLISGEYIENTAEDNFKYGYLIKK